MPREFWDAFARKSYRERADGVPELDRDPNIGEASRKVARIRPFLAWLRKLRLLHRIAGVPIDPWDAFKAVSMPCLVLRGATSDILSEEIVDRMVAVKADLKRATIPKRGHAPLLDEPESLAAIDAFLDQLPQAVT
jgi:pimeloyl-ACP methyl ester carboxylesterase